MQPLLVSTSAIHLAAETVRSILKIDDIVSKVICLTDNPCDVIVISEISRLPALEDNALMLVNVGPTWFPLGLVLDAHDFCIFVLCFF